MTDEYSDEQLDSVVSKTAEWCKAFSKSAEFAALSDAQQREARPITEFFAHYSYTYIGATPENWHPGVVRECCTEILPRKVSAEPAFFDAVAPVLTAFFNFLGTRSLHPRGPALAEAAASGHNRIVATARDRSGWGPAKHLAMAAFEAGVDMRNPKALEEFILRFNLQQASSFQADGSNGASWFSPHMPHAKQKTHNFTAPANRYDPCPCGSGKKYKFCCDARARG